MAPFLSPSKLWLLQEKLPSSAAPQPLKRPKPIPLTNIKGAISGLSTSGKLIAISLLNMARYYKLVNKKPVPMSDDEWRFDRINVSVKRTTLRTATISTVFLGLDHSWNLTGPPLLFETMIFGGPLEGEMWRCSTWDETIKQHDEAVRLAKRATVPDLSSATDS